MFEDAKDEVFGGLEGRPKLHEKAVNIQQQLGKE